MADLIIQSEFITRGRAAPPTPKLRGQVFNFLFRYTFTATFDYDLVTKLELGCLPANCVPTDAVLRSVTSTNVVDVGLMSGDYGDAVTVARTVGDELFDGVTMAVAGTRTINWLDIDAIVPTAYPRGIGLIATAADITSGHSVALRLSYKLGPQDY
jgi:hypothetical protein